MRIVILVLSLIQSLFVSASPSSFLPDVVNGRYVNADDVFEKHVVGVYKYKEVLCSAVLISDRYALTAAHCADDVKGAKLVFGRNKMDWQFREVISSKIHGEYDSEIVGIIDVPANDILLIEFKGGLPFGFSAAQLPTAYENLENQKVTIAGYGLDENEDSNVLKASEVLVVESVPYEFRTTEKNSGSCSGDSGGPVFLKKNANQYVLVGLVSRGDENCSNYGIYENVSYYLGWISNSMNYGRK